ncbi:MAG: hypothetical protein HYX71_11875 [Opitutae bacterium]|nr:hypothetical protein [Opitutae bacterium]
MKTSLFLRLLSIILTATAVSAHAVNRNITIAAPVEVSAGGSVTVAISAGTDAGDGEEVGFFHAEYSTDGGKTWAPIVFARNSGSAVGKEIVFLAGAKGVKSLIRVRAAFRGGKAGDVDLLGKPIEWNGSWENWRAPCTKYAVIYVNGR